MSCGTHCRLPEKTLRRDRMERRDKREKRERDATGREGGEDEEICMQSVKVYIQRMCVFVGFVVGVF